MPAESRIRRTNRGGHMKTPLLALLLALAPFAAQAQSAAATVDGVQMPAWLERDGKRVPLAPGIELRAGDRILSGSGARVAVKLAEGSVVRLGERSEERRVGKEGRSRRLPEPEEEGQPR